MRPTPSSPIDLAHLALLTPVAPATFIAPSPPPWGAGDYYFGVYGKDACADYEVSVELVLLDSACEPTPGTEVDAEGLMHIEMDSFGYANRYGVCKPGGYDEYSFALTQEVAANNNLFVTVRTLTNKRNPEAVSLKLFEGEPPPDRFTEHSAASAADGVWAVSMNSEIVHEGTFYTEVRCGNMDTVYYISHRLCPAVVVLSEVVLGEVCRGTCTPRRSGRTVTAQLLCRGGT